MTAQSNQGSDTPTPACYATFRDGKMDYSEFCVSENLGDFDVSELDADVDIVPLYSEETVSELLAALTAEREKNAKLRQQYDELLFQVGNKHPGESRHETALRYLKAAEVVTDNGAKCAMKEKQ